MLGKGLQATAAINTTQRHDQLHMKFGKKNMHLREEFVFTIVMERSLNSTPASIHQYFLLSVLFIYNLGYRDQKQRQGSIYY